MNEYSGLILKSLFTDTSSVTERLAGKLPLPGCIHPTALSSSTSAFLTHYYLSCAFFPPIKSTLSAYFCSSVVTNVAFSAILNRLTPKQATHSDTGSKTVHPCAALNPTQARLSGREKLQCVVTDQRLVSKFVPRRGPDVKCAFPRARCFPLASWSRMH